MDKKVIDLPKPIISEAAQNLVNFLKEKETIIEFNKAMAKIRKSSYDDHISEGFSKEEALVLCQTLA